MVTLLIFIVAIALLAWGLVRALPYGNVGIFAWLQSVVLMLPWLLFFGLFTVGIYLNLAGFLVLVIASVGIYIYLGRRLRSMGQQELILQQEETTFQETAADADPNRPDSRDSSQEEMTQASNQDQDAQATNVLPESEALEIPADDRAALESIFGVDTFFRTETVPYGQGAIFKGNLRGKPEDTLEKLSTQAEEHLDDRYRLFLLPDPNGKPVVLALPRDTDPKPSTPWQKGLSVVLAIVTFLSCLEASSLLMGSDLFATPGKWQAALPFAAGVFIVLVTHEAGHWLKARQHNIKLSWPFLIPTLEIGSFGAITRIESVLPSRSILFDIAIAGPAVGGILSFCLLIGGMILSHPGSQFQLPAEFFQGSALVGTLARIVLGSALSEPIVDVHPLMLVGWLGLVITALNLLPAGQLDGGRITQAIYGRKIAGRATVVTLIILAIASLANPLALYWAALILFLQRNQERPAMNELTEPDDARAALCLLALFLTLATLVPLTPSLAGRLGIG